MELNRCHTVMKYKCLKIIFKIFSIISPQGNENQNDYEVTSTHTAKMKNTADCKCRPGFKKRNICLHPVGVQSAAATAEISVEIIF